MSGANQLTIDNEQLTIMVSLRDVNSFYWEFRKILTVKDYFIHPRRGFLNCQLSIINCQFTKFLFRQQVVNKPGKKPKYALTGNARYAKIS